MIILCTDFTHSILAAAGKIKQFIVLVSYTSIQSSSFKYDVTEGLGRGISENGFCGINAKCVNKV